MGVLALASGFVAYLLLTGQIQAGVLGPTLRTILLIAVLLPLMGLLILIARRLAVLYLERRRGLMGARMHVRLVGLFAGLSAVPTLLVVIFASLLFQSGTGFWFDDRAQTVLRNAEDVAQAYVVENRERIVGDIVAMGGDLYGYAQEYGVEDELFLDGVDWQRAARNLTEAVVFVPRETGGYVVFAAAGDTDVLGEQAILTERVTPEAMERAARGTTAILTGRIDRVEAVVRMDMATNAYLYASRTVDPGAVEAAQRAASARSDYLKLLENSRTLQWRFNLMLGGVALVVLAAGILSALWLANRLTAPIGRLAFAAERLGGGDLAARVPVRGSPDELATLGRTFNRMAKQLQTQTGALVAANASAEERRSFIEAVVEGVSAGVISVDENGTIELVSTAAEDLLARDEGNLLGQSLETVLPDFASLLEKARVGSIAQGEVRRDHDGDTQTLLVRAGAVPGGAHGYVLTFDDVTQQQADQRRAAWADVARRIAHEIKNPLTPIQLSAERLQRRYGDKIADGDEVFQKLTGTIIRQVGDLRRMVDEFSSFARMPKPVFRAERLGEIARETLFMQEVGNPAIRHRLVREGELPEFVCDRRQIAQALTNLLKNAAEASEGNLDAGLPSPEIEMRLHAEGGVFIVEICDNGPGMPEHLRERVTEPYVTTRAKGTGLGLAIVSKIVEEHGGTLSFHERSGGGTCARMCFDPEELARLRGNAENGTALADG